MNILDKIMKKTEQIDFLFPKNYDQLMNDPYYDYDKFEWFLYYVFKLDNIDIVKVGRKGKGDGGADLIVTQQLETGGVKRIGIQAKYWKNRVGTEPINQLASAKSRHSLTDLWIITTSDLTNDAKEIAEVMNIHILRKNDVIGLIENVKKIYERDISEKGSSTIKFLESKTIKIEPKKEVKEPTVLSSSEVDEKEFDLIRGLRIEIAKKYNIYPIYNVFNNDVANEILIQKPKTKEELLNIKGIGPVKYEKFGTDILEFVNTKLIITNPIYDLLIKERVKISSYNKIPIEKVYSDEVALEISKKIPKNINELLEIKGINKESAKVYAEYLLKIINKLKQ